MRQGAGRGDGQAMVEFALVLTVVLTLLLGCTQIGLYALTRGTAITAAERGIYIAAGAAGSPTGPPATADVYSAIRSELQSGLVGATSAPPSRVRAWLLANRRARYQHRRCCPQRGVRAVT